MEHYCVLTVEHLCMRYGAPL
eukprot:COSAG01_NODE_59164_length_301_cov_30.346535_1_plen_20_part_01